ncbi:MAG: replication-associated recombination protein A [Bacilli bacterium]|nr:replication-associated recombination protein A [Bacilli bacterium]
MNTPLALKLRPKTIDDVIGQKHLVGENAPIRNFINNKRIFSMILYGNPGIGKTSIACAIAESINEKYRVLNATVNNKKDIEVVIEEAKMYDGIVLIMDEIHRLNKDKQDILLPHLESGLITLIGLTTSNPYHKINPAIRSRCQIFELKPLTLDEVIEGLNRAIKCEDLKGIKIKKDVIEYIAKLSSGDLRSAYNLLEICYYSTSDKNITMDVVTKINNKPALFADKDETGHYDLLSAFQKSIRGSDVNAALHYLARLLVIEDLDSIYRRMTVIAYEDIGLANPSMGPKVDACINACERVGMPEAMIPLSVTITEMALSPKSNSAYSALHDAIKDIESGNNYPIPETIRIDSTIYKYPHDYKGSFVVQQYMPDNLINKVYYKPKLTSKYEQNLALIDQRIKKIKEQSK